MASKIIIKWKYHFPGKEVLSMLERPKRTGFSISWHVEDLDAGNDDLGKGVEEWRA